MKEVRAQATVVKSQGGKKAELWRGPGGIYSVYQQTQKVYSAQRYKAQSCKSSGMMQKIVTSERWLWLILKFNVREEREKIWTFLSRNSRAFIFVSNKGIFQQMPFSHFIKIRSICYFLNLVYWTTQRSANEDETQMPSKEAIKKIIDFFSYLKNVIVLSSRLLVLRHRLPSDLQMILKSEPLLLMLWTIYNLDFKSLLIFGKYTRNCRHKSWSFHLFNGVLKITSIRAKWLWVKMTSFPFMHINSARDTRKVLPGFWEKRRFLLLQMGWDYPNNSFWH